MLPDPTASNAGWTVPDTQTLCSCDHFWCVLVVVVDLVRGRWCGPFTADPCFVHRSLSCFSRFQSISGHDPLIDTDYLPCNRKNPAPELSTLCAALRTQDMGNLLLSSPYPVDLCASPDDDVVGHNTDFYQNIIRMKSNIKLEPSEDSWREQGGKKGIKYSHRKAGIICNFINVFKILNAIEK